MIKLEWGQVNGWRMVQHHLHARAPHTALLSVVSQLCGVHAQLMSTAELALWNRVEGLTSEALPHLLWEARTLVKTWAMRGTLHLLTATDYPLYVAGLGTLKHFRRGSWLKYHGVTLEELDTLLQGVPEVLGGTGISREALAEALAEQAGLPKLRELLRSGWGALLKPAAFQGDLCFGPPQGQHVTFVQPTAWLGAWEPQDPDEAMQAIARRFLHTYGPATTDEFGRWWGVDAAAAKRLFRVLGDEIVAVNVEGWEAWALAPTVAAMQASAPMGQVRLLGQFDPYVVAVAKHAPALLPATQQGRVYRSQGWIWAVVAVDGRMVGIWGSEKQRHATTITVEPFAPLDDAVQTGIAQEATRLAQFWGTEVAVVYA